MVIDIAKGTTFPPEFLRYGKIRFHTLFQIPFRPHAELELGVPRGEAAPAYISEIRAGPTSLAIGH